MASYKQVVKEARAILSGVATGVQRFEERLYRLDEGYAYVVRSRAKNWWRRAPEYMWEQEVIDPVRMPFLGTRMIDGVKHNVFDAGTNAEGQHVYYAKLPSHSTPI